MKMVPVLMKITFSEYGAKAEATPQSAGIQVSLNWLEFLSTRCINSTLLSKASLGSLLGTKEVN